MSYFSWLSNYTNSYYFEKKDNDLIFYPWGDPGPSYLINKYMRNKFLLFFILLISICIITITWGIVIAKATIYTIVLSLNAGIFLSVFFPYCFIFIHKRFFKNSKMLRNESMPSRAYQDYKQLMLIQFIIISFIFVFNNQDILICINFVLALISYPILLFWIKITKGNLIQI